MKGDCLVCFFVTDYYLEHLVKSSGRKGRSNIGLLRMEASKRNPVRLEQIRKFLSVAETKIDLVKSLINDWSSNSKHSQVLNSKDLYLTIESKAFVVSTNANGPYKYPVTELSIEQEEADTKMFLCSQSGLQLGFDCVSIATIDTDVAIVAIHFQSVI